MTAFTSLRRRTMLALGVVVLVTLVLLLGGGRLVVAQGFGAVEQRQAHERAALVLRQLDDEQQRISELALDYAAWDDMHQFAAAPSAEFIKSAIPSDWLQRVRLDLVAVLDVKGRVLFAKTSIDGVTVPDLPPQLLPHLREGAPLVRHAGPTASQTGLLVVGEVPWIVAARPIVPSAATGTIRGTFLLARRVDVALLGRFSAAVGLPIALATRHPEAVPVGGVYEMQLTSPDELTAIAPLRDVFGASVGWLTARVPRDIEARRRVTQYYLLLSVLLVTTALLTVVFLLLDRYIVGRVATLASFLRDVGVSGDLTARVVDAHADEIGRVAAAVNMLLGALGERTSELEQARAEACAALEESARKNQELEQANVIIARLAGTDDLTGLANRRMFVSRLEEQIAKGNRTGEFFTVILADIDHFKRVNDTYGHQTGDRVLVHVASTLASHTRGYDLGARHGGEEFAVLLTGTGVEEGAGVAERIRQDVEQLEIPGYDRAVTISLGVAEWGRGDSATTLIRRADEALYRAKSAGRNRVEVEPSEPYAEPEHQAIASAAQISAA